MISMGGVFRPLLIKRGVVMWYDGIFACGHEGRINVVGPNRSREFKIKSRFSGLCPDCYENEKTQRMEEEKKRAGKLADEMELPFLSGTEKQREWANVLRQKFIETLEKCMDNMQEMALLRKEMICQGCQLEELKQKEFVEILNDVMQFAIQVKNSAAFWIDSRLDYEHYYIVKYLYDEMRNKKRKADMEIFVPEDIEEEITVSPENISCHGIVAIKENGNEIKAFYQKNDKFREIVKSKGYSWDGESWTRKLDEKTGMYRDRAAELGNELLKNGYIIKITDEYARQHAIDGGYVPEQHRWVDWNGKKFTIKWPRTTSKEIYNNARKITSSTYASGYIYVKPVYYEEVEDFADIYGFKITSEAKKVIGAYREAFDRIKKVKPEEGNKVEDINKLKVLLEKDGAIITELMDE